MLEENEFSEYPDYYFVEPLSLEKQYLLKRKDKRNTEIFDVDYVKKQERLSFFWLAKEIHFPAMRLMNLIGGIRRGRVHYCYHYKRKKDGSFRVIKEPSPELKKVQKRINYYLLKELPVVKNVFGFSGGSIVDAIKPHLKSKSIMMIDIKDAFSSINFKRIMSSLWSKEKNEGYFSWYVCWAICELCTHENILPQGAPTSPRLFDLAFRRIDKRLNAYAPFVISVYTRYADNIFFSSSREEISKRTKWDIIETIEDKVGLTGICLKWHKFKIYNSVREAVRMLGLNMIQGKIHNTRSFKRRFRLLIHHINWLKKNGYEWDKEYEQLTGMLGFAVKETLPPKLVEEALKIKDSFWQDLS